MSAPKVFISYSWDGDAHQNWVLNLANQLTDNGVDVILDQYELQLGKNLSLFMERAVADADKVLLILTENYKTKAEGRTGGVGYEYSMINSALYQTQTDNKKFLPILRGADRAASTPIFVDAFVNLDMRSDAQFEQQLDTLLRTIFGKPKIVKPPIGTPPNFDVSSTNNPLSTPPTDKPSDSIGNQVTEANKQHQVNKAIQAQKTVIKTQIARANTRKALDLMEELVNTLGDGELSNAVIMLSARFTDYQRDKRLGVSTGEEQRIALARVNHDMLSVLGDIE